MKNKNEMSRHSEHEPESSNRESENSAENVGAEIDEAARRIGEATGETGTNLFKSVNKFFAEKTENDAQNDCEALPRDFAEDAAVTVPVVQGGAQGEIPTAAFAIGESSVKSNDKGVQNLGEELREFVEQNGEPEDAQIMIEEVARGEAAASSESKPGAARQTVESANETKTGATGRANENVGEKETLDAQIDWSGVKTAADIYAVIVKVLSG